MSRYGTSDADAMADALAEHAAAKRPPVIPPDVCAKRHALISDALRAAGELLRRVDRDWAKKPSSIGREIFETRQRIEHELAHATRSGEARAD